MATIATHHGSKVAREHNLRNPKVASKEEHIVQDGEHETWLDESPRKAYRRIFGDAQKEYNDKQTREDRKIRSYYDKIACDGKKHPVYEMVVGVYGEGISDELKKQIMKEYIAGWKERNPNMELIGVYWHNDEKGGAHLHIDYIPVARECTRGMRVQTGQKAALGEMGIKGGPKRTAQVIWQSMENKTLENICNAHGITVEHPQRDGVAHAHLETSLYKVAKEAADKASQEALKATEARDTAQGEYEALQAKITALEASEQAAVARADKAEKEAQEASERLVEAEKKLERAERIIKRGKPSWADKQFSAEAVANAQKLIAEAGSITAAAESKERVASAREEELNKKAKQIQDAALNLNVEKLQLKQQKEEAEQERNIAQRLFARAWNGLKDWLQPMIEEAASRQNNRLRRWLEKYDAEYLAQIDAELMSRNLDELIRDAESIPGGSTGHQTGRGIRDDDVR